MLNIKKLVLLTLLGGILNSNAQQKLSLGQILEEISQNNPSLKAFESQAKSQDAKVSGAGAWMAPMIGVGTFMTPYPGLAVMDEADRGAWMLSAEQEVPNPAKIKARKEYLKTRSETYYHAKNQQFNELRAKARQLYYDLLIDYKKIKYQQESARIMETTKKLAEIRYSYNQGSLAQFFKSEGRAYETQSMIEMVESDIRSRKIALNTLMQRSPGAELEIDTAITISFNPVLNLDTTYLADTRSDILHMSHDIYSMQANINQIRQEAKPDFRIRFEHMSNRAAMMPNQYTLMGMVSIPIAPWSSKMYKSEIKSMTYEKEAMHRQKQAMLTEMLGMARSMENELRSMQKQLSNYQSKILPALTKNMKVSLLAYQENKGDLNSVVDGWEAVNMAQMNYLEQLQKFYQMIVEYEKNIER